MREVIRGWGADFVVTRGRKVFAADLPALVAEDAEGEKVGLLTYEIIGDQCEVVTLDAFTQFSGVGTALMNCVIETARAAGCHRVWLITTNDNLDAIRFYQKRDFTIAAVHVNAIAHSRTLKPSIPIVGNYGIPIRDEIEFEVGV
jgi:ribosomal protein S18 acetylase RimI-like enzyme